MGKLLEMAAAVAVVVIGWEIGKKIFRLNISSETRP